MNTSPLTLKNPRGWFAAGAAVGQALMLLSDGAFKVFVYLCLNAPRDTGILHTTQTALARELKKAHGTIRKYLHEIEAAGICRIHFGNSPVAQGTVEITEAYWPYQRGGVQAVTDAADSFVSQVRRLLQERACVRPSFSTADDVLARKWFSEGIPLDRIRQAILLGCARKYSSWRNNQGHGPIASLRYFENILEEIRERNIPAEYCDYLGFRIQRIEKLWIESHKSQDQSAELTAPQPGTGTGADSLIVNPENPNVP
jgi:hypothetical protein